MIYITFAQCTGRQFKAASGIACASHGVGNAPGQDSPQGAAMVPLRSSLAGQCGMIRVRAFKGPPLEFAGRCVQCDGLPGVGGGGKRKPAIPIIAGTAARVIATAPSGMRPQRCSSPLATQLALHQSSKSWLL